MSGEQKKLSCWKPNEEKKEIKRKKENIKNKYIDYFRYTQTKEILSIETKKW